jgi:succinate-semialdehyde dehydrogenase / glutarate-semialdehyde dehydrogenase
MNAQPSLNEPIALRDPRSGKQSESIRFDDAATLSAHATRLRAGQREWMRIGAQARVDKLLRFATALESSQAVLDALVVDTGRHALARLERQASANLVRRGVDEALKYAWTVHGHSKTPGIEYRTDGVPYPLVAVISPWNFPLLLSMIDTASALLAGCAVWVKPSEVTPRFIAPLQALIEQCELSNVLQFVAGAADVGGAMIAQSDALCFTGSVATGKTVYRACADAFIPAFLELGGKDPLIVLPGADLALAADIALRGSVQANGQACQSIERIYVHQDEEQAFLDLLVARAQKVELSLALGAGQQGPFIFERQAAIVQAQIDDAIAQGAKVLSGGRVEHHGGVWLKPTVLRDVHHRMRVMQEETFGPVLPVMSYQSIEQAIELANDSIFGLSAAVIGEREQALHVATRLQAGAISINDSALTAFVYDVEKQSFGLSGLGASRMGAAGLSRFLRKRSCLIQTGAPFPLAILNEMPVPASTST